MTRLDLLDGSGIYKRDAILGPFNEDRDVPTPVAPQIEEVRAIRGFDGEIYVNVNDLAIGMKKVAFKTNCMSASVIRFIEIINQHLQGD